MQRQSMRFYLPAVIIFIILSAAILLMPAQLEDWGFDRYLILSGNIIIFLITGISFLLGARGLAVKNVHAFFRLVYGSFILKLFALAGAAFAYIMIMKKEVNKPGIFFCMALYLIYTFIEVSALLKISKKKVNG